MPKALFEVGAVERHTIEAKYSLFTSNMKVFVDDKEIISTYIRRFIENRNSYRFSVREREKHDIELIVSGSLTLKFELYVDGKLASVSN